MCDLRAPLLERRDGVPFARLVHGIVDGAAKVPHRDDCAALVSGQRKEGIVEAGGAPAHTPFQNSARQMSGGMSMTPSAGLRVNTL